MQGQPSPPFVTEKIIALKAELIMASSTLRARRERQRDSNARNEMNSRRFIGRPIANTDVCEAQFSTEFKVFGGPLWVISRSLHGPKGRSALPSRADI